MTGTREDVFALIAALREENAEFCVATVVRTANATSAKPGAKAVVLKDGTIRGFLGGGCVQGAVRRTAAAVLREGRPRLIRVKPKDEVVATVDVDGTELHKSGCPSGGTIELFIEPMRLAPRLVVCGASPVATTLAALGRRVGYRVVVAALPEDQGAFDGPAERIEGFDLAPLNIGAEDFIVVATQGKRDREALGAALTSDAAYVAFVGSRKKARTLCDQLREQGIAEPLLRRLASPAGLDIHAIEPEEIAVSILAEVIARRRSAARGETGASEAQAC